MLTAPQNPAQRLGFLREKIAVAARAAGRDPGAIRLVGVAKSQPLARVVAAVDGGLTDLAENYLQEAREHFAALQDRLLTRHFIGALQSNKTRPVAELFDWVHTVDRLKIAERLAEQRPRERPPLAVCIQVRLGGEATKAGVDPGELPALAGRIASLPRISLRGLMCLPPEESDPERQRHWFRALRNLLESLNAAGHRLDALSMGMSNDFESAIAEGATHIRIGTALFGARG
ncbi:MAG: Pyridoxal phosphate homeostasis protein [Steroidobacteraceae bacterium]|nr:Pyridoxal phosphate homeostasis protein [Steroidobacteraceae bacterium]MBM2853965.1 Pyridoxal phosphate homeostasis protein [Steroidobacteraceae bacterium]